ncbi:MAG: putative Ig domain-containing protein, partial [Planctomycetes bacterium]|nr:putative Ig domain-containing protein [Planctomycetota bacterium]
MLRDVITALTVFLTSGSAVAQPCATLPIIDDYEDGVLATDWVDLSTCGSVGEVGGRLILDRSCPAPGTLPGVGWSLDAAQSRICGDFDIRFTYDLLGWGGPPNPGWRWLTLQLTRADDGTSFGGVGRVSTTNVFFPPRQYRAWTTSTDLPPEQTVWTGDDQGELRITRLGPDVVMSYRSPGGDWTILRSVTLDESDVIVSLNTGSDFDLAPYQFAIDDLRIETPTIGACAPTSIDEFEDGLLDPTAIVAGCGSAEEVGGELVLTRSAGCGAVAYRQDSSQIVLCGDFDLQVDLAEDAAPVTAGLRWSGCSLFRAWDDVRFATIERVESTGIPPGWPSSRIYQSLLHQPLTSPEIAPATDGDEALRLKRVGLDVGMYYRNSDGDWTLLRSGRIGDDPMIFELRTRTDIDPAAYEVRWDHLVITQAVTGPVAWPFEAGGNGHYYEVRATPDGITYVDASREAYRAGGHLVSITSDLENAFVARQTTETPGAWFFEDASWAQQLRWGHWEAPTAHRALGPWIGGIQRGMSGLSHCANEPDGGWTWVTREPFVYTAWSSGQPDNTVNAEHYLQLYALAGAWGDEWNDVPVRLDVVGAPFLLSGYVIEYERLPTSELRTHIMPGYPNAPKTDPGERRKVWSGVETLLWGSADNGDGTALGFSYAFTIEPNPNVTVVTDGDSSGVITDDRFIHEAVTLTLAGGSTSEFVAVTLTVDDGVGHVDSQLVELHLLSTADPLADEPLEAQRIDADIAIEEALRWLYLRQRADGSWRGVVELDEAQGEFPVAVTSAIVWAFGNQGHTPGLDPDESIYTEVVRSGVDFILEHAVRGGFETPGADLYRGATASGVSDLNENCQSIAIDGASGNPQRYHYETALAIAALSSTGRPDDLVPPVGEVAGMTYREVVADMVDWFGAVQATDWGGWRYWAAFGGNDMSVSSWVYLAMEAAENVFGVGVPDWLKQNAETFLNIAQTYAFSVGIPFGYQNAVPLACSGYGLSCENAFGTTGGGLSGLALAASEGPFVVPGTILDLGAPPVDGIANKRAQALAFLGHHWDIDAIPAQAGQQGRYLAGNLGNTYAMVSVARGLRLTAHSLGLAPGENLLLTKDGIPFDWETGEEDGSGMIAPPGSPREGYDSYLIRTQVTAGDWADRGHWELFHYGDELNAAFAVLVLTPVVFEFFDDLPPRCRPGGPYVLECDGAATTITLDGSLSRDPEGLPITYQWTTDVPGVDIVGASSATPLLTIDPSLSGAQPIEIELTVSDGVHEATNWVDIALADRRPPLLTVTVDHGPAPIGTFVRGDANDDGVTDISDPVFVLQYLFQFGANDCLEAGDANDDDALDISDPVYTLQYLFQFGPEPPFPFPTCGTAVLALGCESYTSCPTPADLPTAVTVDFAASDSCGVATVIAEVSSDCGVVTLDPADTVIVDCVPGCAIAELAGLPRVDSDSAMLSIVATDEHGSFQRVELALCEDGTNRPPTITSLPITLAAVGTPYEATVIASDPDGDALLFSLDDGEPGLTIDPSTGLLSWIPGAVQLGERTIVVRVDDGRGGAAIQRFGIRVWDPPTGNHWPSITSIAPTGAAEGELYSYNVDADDPDGDLLTYTLLTAPVGMAIDATNGVIAWVPGTAQQGVHDVSIEVRDPYGEVDTQSFVITVDDLLNRPPTITSVAPGAGVEGEYYAYLPVAIDPDGDTLTWFLDAAPTGAFVTPTSGLVQWTPASWQAGSHAFLLRVEDGRGGMAIEPFMVDVAEAIDGPPYFTSTPVIVAAEGSPYEYDVEAIDGEGDPFTFALVVGPTGMSID